MNKEKHRAISLDRISIVHAARRASESVVAKTRTHGIPVVYEEDGVVYRSFADGKIELVKRLPKSRVSVPKTFTLD